MGQIAFSDYISTRPSALTPVGVGDRILILQGGMVKLVPSTDIGGGIVPLVLIDAIATPMTTLPIDGQIAYIKSDASAATCDFQVAVGGQTMCQELMNGLATQGEGITVKLIGTQWYKRP